MKKKKVLLKILSIVLVISLIVTGLSVSSVSAQEAQSKEQLSEKGELWLPETNSSALNTKGDLSIEELQTAKLATIDTPEIVSKEIIKKNGHVNRLWEQEEDLNTIVFQNRDGTKTMYYYSEAVKYVDSDGVVRDKSNVLTDNVSHARFKADYAYVNSANDIRTYFPKTLNEDTGVVIEGYDVNIDFAPISFGSRSSAAKELSLSAKSASAQNGSIQTEQKANQDVALYPGVFGNNTTLRFTPTFEGFKEDILLDCYDGNNEFTYRVKTNGLTLLSEDGLCYFIDPLTGESKAMIDKIMVFDSKENNQVITDTLKAMEATKTAERKTSPSVTKSESVQLETEKDAVSTYNHYYRVETIKPDEEYLITLVVDEEYLKSEETVYPVTIDPCTTIIANGSGADKTIMDAPIYNGRPTRAHGENHYSVIGYVPSYDGTYFGVGRNLIKFPGLINNPIFQNTNDYDIYNVNVYMRATGGGSSPTWIDAYIFNGSAWTEDTVTCQSLDWDNYSSLLDCSYISGASWTYFNITEAVKSWKNQPSNANKGIILKNENEENSGCQWNFATTEYNNGSSSYKPFLAFNYNHNTTSSVGITDGGTYYIKNNTSKKYMEHSKSNGVIQNPKSTVIADIPYQRWRINRWGQGMYWLQPMDGYNRDDNEYPYALTANASGQLYVTQKSATVDVSQLFILTKNNDGTYYIRPAITGTDRSLAVLDVDSGIPVSTVTHSSFIPCMKWIFEEENTFTATVNNYYDNGYRVRYDGTGSNAPNNKIASYQTWVNSKYSSIFGLNITNNTPTLINSNVDLCKISRGITIDEDTIEWPCVGKNIGHDPKCNQKTEMYNDFIGRFPGNDLKVNVLWSGHILDENRSFCSWYAGINGIMIIDNRKEANREEEERYTILHELAHNFGAPDHYCENTLSEEDCGMELCYRHHSERGYSENCLMGKFISDISTYDNEDIFCDKCTETIKEHIRQHH